MQTRTDAKQYSRLVRNTVFGVTLSGIFAVSAWADINVGVTLSATGPAAVLGIPERNTVEFCPTTIAGEMVNYVVLDDATNPGEATKNARKFVTENRADVIIGSSTVPTGLAVTEVAHETKTPQLLLAPTPYTDPAKDAWAFRLPQSSGLMAKALVEHMKATKVKTLGFIGYADSFGESFLNGLKAALDGSNIKLTVVERYNRTDTSVTGQALKVISANPDAVLVVGSGTPAALPQTTLVERGYKGRFYQSHGAVSRPFLKVGGKAVDGTVFPIGPIVVAEQLSDSHPSRKVALAYQKKYEAKYGAGSVSSFGGHMYDACLVLQAAVPTALKKAKPGTAEFRAALRDAIEATRDIVGTHGVFNYTAKDHYGHDQRARVLIIADNGDWKLIKQPAK
ncbi:MAG TPA: ABC transporter substrate-binding protein [Burkholderiales bacterium]